MEACRTTTGTSATLTCHAAAAAPARRCRRIFVSLTNASARAYPISSFTWLPYET
jgi:hypothetical protein